MTPANIAAAIRSIRKQQGLSQEGLAAAITASGRPTKQSDVSYWETGKRVPDLGDVSAIERGLGVPRGRVLLAAGLVEEVASVESAVAADASLAEEFKGDVIKVYRAFLAAGGRTS